MVEDVRKSIVLIVDAEEITSSSASIKQTTTSVSEIESLGSSEPSYSEETSESPTTCCFPLLQRISTLSPVNSPTKKGKKQRMSKNNQRISETVMNNRRIIGQYEVLETLGKGMSGKVKKGIHIVTGEKVALKIIEKAKATKRTLTQLHTEIIALKTLNHPNILQLLHVDLDAVYPKKNGSQVASIVLALQLAEGGELFDFMMFTGSFSEVIARTLFRQLLSALHYCHARGVYHRDIKPENLLLDDKFQLKIADFGLAAIRSDPSEMLRTECGTRSYMAPEVLCHQEYDGAKADVWSAGVVLFILLAGNPPFQMAKKGDWWFNAVMEGDYEKFWKAHKRYAPHFPFGAQSFLSQVFQSDPETRPAVEDLINHDWVQGMCLSNQLLYTEMSNRRNQVQKEKQKEKEKAKEVKARQAAAGGTQAGAAYFDPWTNIQKQRSCPGGDEIVEVAPEIIAPVKKGDVEVYTHFYSPAPADLVMERLQSACGLRHGQAEAKGPFYLMAILRLSNVSVAVDIKVYSVPSEGGINLVEVKRKQGDTFVFHKLYNELLAKVSDILGGAFRDNFLSANEDSKSFSGEMHPEEDLTDYVGMI